MRTVSFDSEVYEFTEQNYILYLACVAISRNKKKCAKKFGTLVKPSQAPLPAPAPAPAEPGDPPPPARPKNI